jgi:hypothetical protein
MDWSGLYLECDKCQGQYIKGTPHICNINDRSVAELALEHYLIGRGGFTIEHH